MNPAAAVRIRAGSGLKPQSEWRDASDHHRPAHHQVAVCGAAAPLALRARNTPLRPRARAQHREFEGLGVSVKPC